VCVAEAAATGARIVESERRAAARRVEGAVASAGGSSWMGSASAAVSDVIRTATPAVEAQSRGMQAVAVAAIVVAMAVAFVVWRVT
jgi:hypothetical protein